LPFYERGDLLQFVFGAHQKYRNRKLLFPRIFRQIVEGVRALHEVNGTRKQAKEIKVRNIEGLQTW